MIKYFKKFRKSKITKEEIIADLIFLLVPAFVSFCVIFIFDIHHSLYSFPIFPLKFVFQSKTAYMIGIPIGSLIGFFIIKILIFGLKEQRKA